jgi:O-antigen/teichoic acid export membrane protein
LDFDVGHFSHRWHHPLTGHHGECDHAAAAKNDDLRRLGLVLSIGRAGGGLAALGWTVYAARRLQTDWGRLSAVLSYAAVASIGTDLGIPLALTKLACRNKTLDREAVFGAIRRRAVAGGIASIVLVFAWINTKSAGGRWGLAALYGISVTVTPVTGSFLALLRGRAIGSIEAWYDVIKQIALPFLGIAAIENGLGVFGVLASYVAVDAGSALIIVALSRRRVALSPSVNREEENELRLRQTIPLSGATIVGSAYDRVDSAMLAPLAGAAAIGIYRMISPIYGAVLMPARALGDTAAVGAGRGESSQARATAAKFALRAAAVTVPLAILLAALGPPVLPHVLRVKASARNPHPINWTKAAAPLRILMLTAIPSAALAVLTPVALLAQRDRVFRYALAALGGNIVLNLLFVPSWALGLGASGAALAFLITETTLVGVLWLTLPSATSATSTSATG